MGAGRIERGAHRVRFGGSRPDGRRIEGKAALIEFWRGWFVRNSDARFDAEEVIVSESRATVP